MSKLTCPVCGTHIDTETGKGFTESGSEAFSIEKLKQENTSLIEQVNELKKGKESGGKKGFFDEMFG